MINHIYDKLNAKYKKAAVEYQVLDEQGKINLDELNRVTVELNKGHDRIDYFFDDIAVLERLYDFLDDLDIDLEYIKRRLERDYIIYSIVIRHDKIEVREHDIRNITDEIAHNATYRGQQDTKKQAILSILIG